MATPEIVTQRLILNPHIAGDAAALFEYRSDPAVSRYLSWEPTSLEDAQRFIENTQSLASGTPGTWCQLAVRLRGSDDLVGDLGARTLADDPRQVEVGYTLAPKHQGKGFGTEAVAGLLGHLFGPLQKHRVFASVDPQNKASMALLERLGMRQEAHFRKSLWFKGEWVDDVVFAILESDWRGR